MNNTSNVNNLNILAASLFQLCSNKSNGSLYIFTKDNLPAQFQIKNGKILTFLFNDKFDSTSLETFKKATYESTHFVKDYQSADLEANVISSNGLLRDLGYEHFLSEQIKSHRKQLQFKCVRPEFFGYYEHKARNRVA